MDDLDDIESGSESGIVARVKRAKKDADASLGQWREDAREAYRFVAGDQWDANDKAKLLEMQRAPVVFNRIAPMIDSVAGSEVNNRQQVQFMPRQPGDSAVNEILSGAADYIRDNCNAEDEESDAFIDAVICGVGFTETFLEYVDNPEGAVEIERRDPLTMRWDCAAKRRNLADAKWFQREEWLDKEDIEHRWGEKAEDIGATDDWGAEDDGEVHDQTLAWQYERDATGYDKKTKKYRVIHHQWYELESFVQVLDPASGQVQEMAEDEFEKVNERAATLGMPLQSVKKQRKAFKQGFVCGNVLLESGPCPTNDFSYKAITAKRDRNKNTWYGIVKAMIDPQRWANKFFSQVLHIINTNSKGGLMIEDAATDNLNKLKEDWAKADSVVVLNDGAIAGGKIMPKPVANVPTQIEAMLSFSISSIRDVSGINLEMLGMADRQQAGVLEAQRKQAAMTVLASLFDALRLYRKNQGRLLAKFIVEYMADGRLVRIVGGDGLEQYVPLLKDAVTMEYDVVVDEAATTANSKDKTFAILMQLMPNLAQMGVPFGPSLLEYLPLPSAMVAKWREEMDKQAQEPKPPSPQEIAAQANMIKAQAQAQQVQQAGQLAQMQGQADMMKAQADGQRVQVDAQMRQAEIPVRMAELDVRRVEAQVNQLQAMVEMLAARLQLATLSAQGAQPGTGAVTPQTLPQ